eukprot:Sspe_Gene.12766::Locus_4358_Transcript_1_1_Confidence_1.000_Length_3192::g.12766::m.12766
MPGENGTVAQSLSKEQIEQLHETFRKLDVNADGLLDQEEILNLLRSTFARTPEDTIQEIAKIIFSTADSNKDGKIDLAEFIKSVAAGEGVLPSQVVVIDSATKRITEILTDEEIEVLRHAFLTLDENGDGFLSHDELKKALNSEMQVRFPGMADSTLDELVSLSMKAADRDKDGKISLTEFIASFTEGKLPVSMDSVMHTYNQLKRRLFDWELEALRKSFKELDSNQDGYLDFKELIGPVGTLLSTHYPDMDDARRTEAVEHIIRTADKDGDERLSLAEFIRSYAEDQGVLPEDFITNHAPPGAQPSVPVTSQDTSPQEAALSPGGLTTEQIHQLRSAFLALDHNGDGFIDYGELRDELNNVLHHFNMEGDELLVCFETIVQCAIEHIINSADSDKDGKINLSEFLQSFEEGQGVLDLPAAGAHSRVVEEMKGLLTPQELRQIRKVFESLDKNRDGYLTKEELSHVMDSLLVERVPGLEDAPDRRDQVIDLLINAADVDQDGRLSLDEFVRSFYTSAGVIPLDYIKSVAGKLAKRLTHEEVEVLKKVFAEVDRNGDGFIDEPELRKLLLHLLQQYSHETVNMDWVEELVQEVMGGTDKDADGKVNLTEFIRSFALEQGIGGVLTEHAQNVERGREAMDALHQMFSDDDMRKLGRMFEHLDKNCDGYLERDEVSRLMHKLLAERVQELDKDTEKRDKVIDLILDNADVDRDGRISLVEFYHSFISSCGIIPLDYIQKTADKLSRNLTKEEVEALKTAFRKIDANSDGQLDEVELRKLLQAIMVSVDEETLQEVVDLILQCSDKNKDGRINLTEFIRSFAMDQGLGAIIMNSETKRYAADAEVEQLMGSGDQSPHKTPSKKASPSKAVAKAQEEEVEGAASPFPSDVSGVPFTDEMLRQEFRRMDADGTGFLSRSEFKKVYQEMEWCGLEPSDREIDRLFSQFGGDDDKLSYDEFCVLMLHRARM